MRRSAASAALALAAALPAGAPAPAAEDWIGIDESPPLLLGVDSGRDANGDPQWSLLVDAAFDPRAGFTGFYGTTEISDGAQRFDSHGFVSAIWFEVNELLDVELSHFFDGNAGELEREALGLGLGLDLGEWRLGIELSDGETLIYTRDIGIPLIDDRVPDFIDSDVEGRGISLSSQGLGWYWRVAYQRFDYERDLSPLADSRLVQALVSASALAQSGLLIDEQASLLLGHDDLVDDVSLLLARDRSAVDGSEADALGLSWLRWSDGGLGYRLSASLPLPLDDDLGLAIGLRWIL